MVDVSRVVLAVDSSQVRTASGDLQGMNKTAGMLGRALVGLASGFTALSAIRSTVTVVAQFGQAMAEVSAITRATGEELSQMEKVARQLGSSTEFTASQAASAFKFMGMAGFTATESIAAIPDVLNLATAAALDLGVAADISSNVMSGFGISADNASRAVDVLAAASSRSNTNVAQLGSAIAFVGPVASAMGIDIGDAAAAIGVLSDAGIQGSAAGTGLRRVLSSLANPTGAAADSLRNLGVNLRDVNPATNDLTDIIDRLSGVGMTAADALTIFGDRGGPAVLALVENNGRVRELADELSNVEGEAKRMADTMRDTLMMDSKALGSALQELALVIGGTQHDSMRSALQGATGIVRDIGIELQAFTTYTLDSGEAATAASTDYMTAGEALRHLLNIVNITAIEFQDLGDWMGYQAARAQMLAEREVAARTFQFGKVKRINDQIIAMDIDRANRRAAAESRISNAISAQESASRRLRAELEREEVAVEKVSDALSDVSVMVTRVAKDQSVLEAATKQAADEQERFADALERTLDRLYPGRQAVRELQEEYRILTQALDGTLEAQQNLDNWLEKNVLAEVTVTARKHVKDLKEEADPFAKAWEKAMERIDTAFADAWKGAFDSFSDFADGLKNAFKQLMAEMAHMAITRPILVSLGLMGGSSGAMAGGGSLLSGASSGASLLSTIGGGIGAMGGTLVGGITGVGSALGLGSQTGALVGGLGSLGNSALGMFGMGGAGAGASFLAGAGIAGIAAFAATQALGSLFGSDGNKRAGVGINTGTGSLATFGKGKNLGPAEEIGQALQAFSQAIGGSGSMLEIAIGNKSGIQLNAKKFADSASLINAAMDEILDTSWHLAPVVRDLAKSFSGSLEATAAYAQAMQGIWQMANQNPVRMAMQDMESANTTVMQAYRDQVSAISQLVANFDGSAGAAQNLNAALAQNQQFAYQLAVAIRQVSGQLDSMFSGSAQAIRESAMTEEERLASMQEQRRSVLQSINELYDPAEINAAAREFDRLNNAIFEMAGRPSGQAEAFAAYAERANEVAQTQLDRVLKSIETSQAEQNRDIRNGMLEAATSQQQAANTMMEAANIIASAAYSFRSTGGQEVVI